MKKSLQSLLIIGITCIGLSNVSYADLNPKGPRFLSRSCTVSDDPMLAFITGPLIWYVGNAAIDGVREGVSWYTNLGLGDVGYLHTKSVRLKRTNVSSYYTTDGQYKHSEPDNLAVETWHSYAGNTYDLDRVNLSTHYLNVEAGHWWWNPKKSKI